MRRGLDPGRRMGPMVCIKPPGIGLAETGPDARGLQPALLDSSE
ncbi:hypothetical protein HMPREF0185_02768 [Brevundimonas diminuta 470-4]|nr:hypothetical protein HMPREF0185_02768 [Brevundimonas diminuta 470-4]